MERTSNPGLHEYIGHLVLELDPNCNKHIIDLGCGSGALLERLAKGGHKNLVGADIQPPTSTASIKYEQIDLDSFSLKSSHQRFNIALSIEVIEHIENTGSFLDELARLLEPGGLALFTTPNLHSSQSKIRFALSDNLKQFDRKGDPTHVSPIFLFPFTKMLKRHGFAVKKTWSYPLDGTSPTSRPLLRLINKPLSIAITNKVGHGDTLIILAERQKNTSYNKQKHVTSHYYQPNNQ